MVSVLYHFLPELSSTCHPNLMLLDFIILISPDNVNEGARGSVVG
jgi:hypothetical protein